MDEHIFEYKNFTIRGKLIDGLLISLHEVKFFDNTEGLELKQTAEIMEVFKKSYMERK